MDLGNYSTILSPLVALAAVGVIVLLCRWVFSTSHRDQRAAQREVRAAARPDDYGLLVPVSASRTREDAEALREVLVRHGIRGTVAASGEGAAVLVFRADADRARSLVG